MISAESSKPKPKENTSSDDDHLDGDPLSTMDPAFIHQVLLTDPSDFSSLSLSSSSSSPVTNKNITLSFPEFSSSLDTDKRNLNQLDSSLIMKKAIRDHICETLCSTRPFCLKPLKDLVLKVHQQIRSLIPNRKDLHSILDDDSVYKAQKLQDLHPLILKAAKSLAQLESESRSSTTLALVNNTTWNQQQQSTAPDDDDDDNNNNNNNNEVMIKNSVTTILYLHYKAELCHVDKQDFYLIHVWAPRIHREGSQLERNFFQSRFGNFSDPASAPATRHWIQSLLINSFKSTVQSTDDANDNNNNNNNKSNNLSRKELLQVSEDERKNLIRAGWIEDIVFRDAKQSALPIPEIFAHDTNSLQKLREVTRLAVAGCALALHATNTATSSSVNPQTINREINVVPEHATANEKHRSPRIQLVQALRNRMIPPDTYEANVSNAVIELAIERNSSLRESPASSNTDNHPQLLESLRNRTVAVLRGEDPVLQLLNTRIKEAVRDIVVQRIHSRENKFIPVESMTTGVALPVHQNHRQSDSFTPQHCAEKLLCQRGLSFFASELALMSKHASKIVEVAINIYWNDLLNKMVLDSCR